MPTLGTYAYFMQYWRVVKSLVLQEEEKSAYCRRLDSEREGLLQELSVFPVF